MYFMLLYMFMKKAFIQLLQWILKYKKRLIYWVLALFIVQVCFFSLGWIVWDNEVYAQAQNTQTNDSTQNANFQEQATEWYWTMAFAQKLVYVLIYPVLIVAGKLVDNSLVYWEVFWFDAILRKLWVIVRNLANFWLWFIFIYKIFEILIKGKEWEWVKKLLISALIAGVWIQASWFAMAALIDMSTILTYWIWGLPISVLWGDESKSWDWDSKDKDQWYDPYVLKTVVSFDAKDMDSFRTYLTNTDKDVNGEVISDSNRFYISECETFVYEYTGAANTWNRYSEELIIWPKMIYYENKDGKFFGTKELMCNYFGQVYVFSKLYSKWEDTKLKFTSFKEKTKQEETSVKDDQNKYDNSIASVTTALKSASKDELLAAISAGTILQVWDAHSDWTISGIWNVKYTESQKWWLDVDNARIGEGGKVTSKLHNLIDWDSYVWVFTALYASLINAWRDVIISDWSPYASLLNTALSFLHMLAIAIPLIVVALVFMMRIGVLWLAIALSPAIILLKAFWFDKSDFMKKWIFDYLMIENLLPIIFYPAIICFAISLSTVFVRKISDLNREKIETLWGSEILWWLIKLNIEWFSIWIWKLVVAVMWVAITWFLVRAAVECSKLWKTWIVKSMKWLANDAILSAKLIPIPWKDGKSTMVWIWTAFGLQTDSSWNIVSWDWIISRMTARAKTQFENEDNEAIRQMFMSEEEKEEEKKKNKKASSGRYQTALLSYESWSVPNNWTEEPINVGSDGEKATRKWSDLDASAQKSVIEWINKITNESRRKEYGKTPEVELKDWTKYKFNGDKYEPQS